MTPEEREAYERSKRLSASENARLKEEALIACAVQQDALLKCLKGGWFGKPCNEEHDAFWECYRKHRGFLVNKWVQWMDQAMSLRGQTVEPEPAAGASSKPSENAALYTRLMRPYTTQVRGLYVGSHSHRLLMEYSWSIHGVCDDGTRNHRVFTKHVA
eukprot:jgi/Mesvir1/21449/Mv24127-RA.1